MNERKAGNGGGSREVRAAGWTERVALSIRGLTCGGGEALTVEWELSRLAGVVGVYVNPATDTAYVEFDPVAVGVAELPETIWRCGYAVGGMRSA
ncbi:MAG: heavy-metal-associated domain-containing protein [Gemmatimonadetes bacterium]|nr:heavy-metal-associated domain-containing protein [Gemmatimonadota bacterium]